MTRSALWTLRGKKLGVLGLAFKGGTDDIRESPAILLVQALLQEGCQIAAYDPAAVERAREVLKSSVDFVNNAYEAANDAYCRGHCKSREDILGSSVEDVWGRMTFRKVIKGYLDQCFKGEEVHYQAWFDMHTVGRRYFDVSYYPYQQKSAITHAIVVTRDVTDRWRAERALRDNEEQFRTLMDELRMIAPAVHRKIA